MIFSGACDVLSRTVRGAKIRAIGGSYLVVTSLFLLILFINLVGLLPYTFRVRSHIVFVLTFGFSFWFGLVSSRIVFGHVLTPMANLVFIGVGVLGGAILCWVEKLRIFLRVFTLRIRLVVNTAVGQAAFSLMGGLAVSYFFEGKGWLILVVIAGVGLLMVEVAVSLIQAYLFCLLLRFYRNEHSV
ncbi:MAG: F0F1 ATP synthase subunit A [Candidatus Sedimenticola sp. 20ELBAFRAG]